MKMIYGEKAKLKDGRSIIDVKYQELNYKHNVGEGFWYELHLLSGEVLEVKLVESK